MSYNPPKQIASEFAQFGINKAEMPIYKFALLAFLGGTFIAFGGLLTIMVAGGMPQIAALNPGLIKLVAGALFPVGLIMVTIAGADLFTSDCTAMVLPYWQKQINIKAVIRILCISYVCNFIGTQFIAYYMSSEVGMFAQDPWRSYLHNMATMKVDQSFHQIFLKGIGANWLVCLGAWMGFAGKDTTSKVIGIWVPVMIFVTLGYEHSIANMFFIPAAIYSGADITWCSFVTNNLIPSTIGNLIGGTVLVGAIYWYIYMQRADKSKN